jgi:hypothetical protein
LAAETPELSEEQVEKATSLLDIRKIIGGLLGVYGLLLLGAGLFGSEADKEKAAGVNINLWVALALLVASALSSLGASHVRWWTSSRRLRASEKPSRRTRRDPDRARRQGRPGRKQREHRAAEAAAHDPRAERSGALAFLDRLLDLGDRDLIVVAQAGVGGVEQAPELGELAGLERANGGVHARVLAQDVADTAVERVG